MYNCENFENDVFYMQEYLNSVNHLELNILMYTPVQK